MSVPIVLKVCLGLLGISAVIGAITFLGTANSYSEPANKKELEDLIRTAFNSPERVTYSGPTWIPLSEDTEYKNESSNPYKDKYSYKYNKYLVAITTNSTEGSQNINNQWWDWKYKQSLENSKPESGKFSVVTSGSTENNSLKSVCQEAYKLDLNVFKSTPTESTQDSFKEEEIWKYCSIGGTKIKTISEVKDERYKKTNAHGKDRASFMVSVTDKGSDWFWDLRAKDLKSKYERQSDQELVKSLKNRMEGFEQLHLDLMVGILKSVCKDIYSRTASEIPKKDAFEMCSLKGEE